MIDSKMECITISLVCNALFLRFLFKNTNKTVNAKERKPSNN